MSLYIDTSCFLKLFLDEPGGERVDEIIESQRRVLVSSLCLVETAVRFQRLRREGIVTASGQKRLLAEVDAKLAMPPFELIELTADVFTLALAQTRTLRYCKTLDRLHIAGAVAAHATAFLTSDDNQATAARALRLQVMTS